MLTEEPVAVMSISSPAAAPDARISIPPAVDSTLIESAALSPAERTKDPAVAARVRSPAAALKFEAVALSRDIPPPASRVIFEPTALTSTEWSAPRTRLPAPEAFVFDEETTRFTGDISLATILKCDASLASIVTAFSAPISIPPADAVNAIAPVPVP